MVSALLFLPCVVVPIFSLVAVSHLAVLFVKYHVQKDKVRGPHFPLVFLKSSFSGFSHPQTDADRWVQVYILNQEVILKDPSS